MKRTTDEGRIIGTLLDHAIASGYSLTVFDGEDYACCNRRDADDVLRLMGATDEEIVVLRRDGIHVADVTLIYGNEPYEVVADYASNDLNAFEAWLAPVTAEAKAVAAEYGISL